MPKEKIFSENEQAKFNLSRSKSDEAIQHYPSEDSTGAGEVNMPENKLLVPEQFIMEEKTLEILDQIEKRGGVYKLVTSIISGDEDATSFFNKEIVNQNYQVSVIVEINENKNKHIPWQEASNIDVHLNLPYTKTKERGSSVKVWPRGREERVFEGADNNNTEERNNLLLEKLMEKFGVTDVLKLPNLNRPTSPLKICDGLNIYLSSYKGGGIQHFK